jgi:hypothetical protein
VNWTYLHLLRAEPPYTSAEPVQNLPRWVPPRGTVVILDVRAIGGVQVSELAQAARLIRADLDVAVALRLPDLAAPEAHAIAALCHPLGFRALLTPGAPIAATLFHALANQLTLGADVVAWLRTRVEVGTKAAGAILPILETARSAPTFRSACDAARINPRTVHRLVSVDGLPGPERWYHLGRMLALQQDLICDPELQVETAAARWGYADGLSLNNRLTKTFGVGASRGRQLLGIEWRLAAWWERCRSENPTAPI